MTTRGSQHDFRFGIGYAEGLNQDLILRGVERRDRLVEGLLLEAGPGGPVVDDLATKLIVAKRILV